MLFERDNATLQRFFAQFTFLFSFSLYYTEAHLADFSWKRKLSFPLPLYLLFLPCLLFFR